MRHIEPLEKVAVLKQHTPFHNIEERVFKKCVRSLELFFWMNQTFLCQFCTEATVQPMDSDSVLLEAERRERKNDQMRSTTDDRGEKRPDKSFVLELQQEIADLKKKGAELGPQWAKCGNCVLSSRAATLGKSVDSWKCCIMSLSMDMTQHIPNVSGQRQQKCKSWRHLKSERFLID